VGSTLTLAHPLYYKRLVQLASTIFGTTNHLSRLTIDFTEDTTPISETFPDEQLMHIAHNPAPWFVDIVNYLVTGQMPLHWGQQDKL
jgi:hypothetical protein